MHSACTFIVYLLFIHCALSQYLFSSAIFTIGANRTISTSYDEKTFTADNGDFIIANLQSVLLEENVCLYAHKIISYYIEGTTPIYITNGSTIN